MRKIPLIPIAGLATVTVALAIGDTGTRDPSTLESGVAAGDSRLDRRPQQSVAGCPTETHSWLSLEPKPLRVCNGGSPNLTVLGLVPADVNCDGQPEALEASAQFDPVYAGQVQNIPDTIFWLRMASDGEELELRRQSVFRPGTQVGQAFRTAFPNGQHVRVFLKGWLDADLDGDLDLIAWVYVDSFGSNYWFENIGYEKPVPPIAADINGDGRVDGADLGLLLVAWGPNP